jgi:hypothetical protein
MRYSKKELSIIHKFMYDLSTSQVQEQLLNNGLKWRSLKSIQKQINLKKEQDDKKEKRRLYIEKYAKNNPVKYRARTLWIGAYNRAKKKDLEFDLTIDWIESKLKEGVCEMTGMEFQIKEYSKQGHLERTNPYAPSIDRINPDKGYTKDNVQVVLNNYNKFKADSRTEDSIIIARALVEKTKHILISE